MRNLGGIVSAIGILVFIYAFAGRFVGRPTIGLNIVEVSATAGLVVANSMMLIGIIITLWDRQI